MNESCHIWMSHVTYEWVMSHMNESCHIWTSHVPFEWVMSQMNESCHIWTSHVTYEWVMSHMNESRHGTYDEVASFMKEWDHTYLCPHWLVIWDIAQSYGTWLTRDITHMGHDSYGTWLICSYETLRSHMGHEPFTRDMTHTGHDSYGTGLIWDMSQLDMTQMGHDSWIPHTRRELDPHSRPCPTSICPVYTWVMWVRHSHITSTYCTPSTSICPVYTWVMSHTWTRHSHITSTYCIWWAGRAFDAIVTCHTCECVTLTSHSIVTCHTCECVTLTSHALVTCHTCECVTLTSHRPTALHVLDAIDICHVTSSHVMTWTYYSHDMDLLHSMYLMPMSRWCIPQCTTIRWVGRAFIYEIVTLSSMA